MTNIVTTIDGIHGVIKIQIDHEQERQTLELKWCVFDQEEDGLVGFMASFTDLPILVTEIAAEQFVRMVLANVARSLDIQTGQLKILNHLGEEMQDIEFLPPTFEGSEAEILYLIAKQDSLRKIFYAYERSGDLSEDTILACQQEDILDDFLSLVQVKASGLVLALRQPNTEE